MEQLARVFHESGGLTHAAPARLRLLGVGKAGIGLARNVSCSLRRTPSTRLYSCGKTLMNREASIVPVVENPLARVAAGQLQMARDQIADKFDIFVLRAPAQDRPTSRLQRFSVKSPRLVEDVGDAAAHAGGEVSAAGAEHHDQAVRHVFAAVVANAFDHCGRAGVANREALAGDAVEERFAAGRAVEGDVADQDVFFGGETWNCVGGYTMTVPPESPLPT